MYNTKIHVYDDGALEIFLCSGETIIEKRYVMAPLDKVLISTAVEEYDIKCKEANAEFYNTCNILRSMRVSFIEATDEDRTKNYNLIV